MNTDTFNNLKVGDKVKCVNSKGWARFAEGEVYTVTEVWLPEGVDLDGECVSSFFKEDFEIIKEAK